MQIRTAKYWQKTKYFLSKRWKVKKNQKGQKSIIILNFMIVLETRDKCIRFQLKLNVKSLNHNTQIR